MHSHEKTLLQKLGFADEDKGSRHDLACKYLCQSHVHQRVMESFLEKHKKGRYKHELVRSCRTEIPISKGEDRYKTTIGFIDVMLLSSVLYVPPPPGSASEVIHPLDRYDFCLKIEVKASPSSISEALRQIQLYREYQDSQESCISAWLLVTTFRIPQDDVQLLLREGIQHARLGPKFEEYATEQERNPVPDDSTEL